MALTDTPGFGYPTSVGSKWFDVIEHIGPASYTTGGETFTAAQLGLGGFDWVDVPAALAAAGGGNSQSGTFLIKVIYPGGSAINGCVPTVKLQWFTAATGVEVANTTNLSAEVARLFIFGV